MFDVDRPTHSEAQYNWNTDPTNRASWNVQEALHAFEHALWRGMLFRLARRLARTRCNLFDLYAVRKVCSFLNASPARDALVPVKMVLGTEGRTSDFDAYFHPMRRNMRDRWVSVAMVHLLGISLPPVDLIQVEQIFFVRDGNHRISVARQMGQHVLDARVQVWQLDRAVPWDSI